MLEITKRLIDGIMRDMIPNTATCIDFGIDNSDPTRIFGAYQWGLKHQTFTEEELDRALGNGPALTELVNRGDNPYGKDLTIQTIWDDMPEED